MAEEIYKNYPDSHASKDELDDNSSLKKMLGLVGENKRVVDFGCASGYFARLLTEAGCEVVGIEINPEAAKLAEQYCQKVIVADLDYQSVGDILAEQQFDVATFGDVLEHLKNPAKLLKSVRNILRPEGFVVASIPNIAHGAVRLALLEGRFEYDELGLLDNTHLRFFTRDSLYQLFEDSGYCIEAETSTQLPVFHSSDLAPHIDQASFPAEVVHQIIQDPSAEILQFVVRAYPWSMAHEHRALRLYAEQLAAELQTAQRRFERTASQLQDTQNELQRVQSELQGARAEIETLRNDWQACQNSVTAMKSSKFWKAREVWFTLKNRMLPGLLKR